MKHFLKDTLSEVHIQLLTLSSIQFSSVAQSCLTLCNPFDWGQQARSPCRSPAAGVYSNSCPLSW